MEYTIMSNLKQKIICIQVIAQQERKRKMRKTNATTENNIKNFLNGVEKRPYPFNTPRGIVAPAHCIFSGLSADEKVKVANMYNE